MSAVRNIRFPYERSTQRDAMNKLSMAAALALTVTAIGAAQAQDTTDAMPTDREIHGVASFGLTGGGETVAVAQFSDGSEQKIRTGGLVELKLGVEYRRAGSALATQINIGYHVDGIAASNGNARFSRYPLELLGYWHINPNVRLGGGLRWALNPTYSASGAAGEGSLNFKSSTGYVLEGEYLFNPQLGLSLRGVSETYNPDGPLGKISGNHVGLRFNYYF
jgi:hypothetical protein